MKPFNLKEHLEHPDWKVQTREGRPVRIVYTELDDSDYPVVAIISNWHPQKFTAARRQNTTSSLPLKGSSTKGG